MSEPYRIATLGESRFLSPLDLSQAQGDGLGDYVTEDRRILSRHEWGAREPIDPQESFEKAGPREKLFFDPQKVRAAIVTCGGLSPGINSVVRSLFRELHYNYRVPTILGIPFGYAGLVEGSRFAPTELNDDALEDIDRLGGTFLGTSRGSQSVEEQVRFLVDRRIDMLFCIGGDGTQRGACALFREITRQGLPIAIVGVPKTIDNDIPYVSQSFGYATALERSAEVIRCAHAEARSVENGIGLVKLMGRHAGFIAAGATLVSQEANFVLVPEVRFELDGPMGLLEAIEERVRRRGHAVLAVAEGAGQYLFPTGDAGRDASGNPKPHDIGTFLKSVIERRFADRQLPVSVKYFDPSYLVRSSPANSWDRLICDQAARHAAHAAMAGKTGLVVGNWHDDWIHLPLETVIAGKKRLDLEGALWTSALLATGQPRWQPNPDC
jgi:6-phosphofructokinase 1